MKKLITLALMIISITLSAQDIVVVAESMDGGKTLNQCAGLLKVSDEGLDGTISGVRFDVDVNPEGAYYEVDGCRVYEYEADYEINGKHFQGQKLLIEYIDKYVILGFLIKENLILYFCVRAKEKRI